MTKLDQINYYIEYSCNIKNIERFVEKIDNSNFCHNNYSNKDNFHKNKRKNYYGKKRRFYNDYC